MKKQTDQKNKMGTMAVGPLVFSMALPLMASMLIQSLYNIVDGIFVARLSEDALTATSLAYPMQFLMIAISVGSSVGLNALLSKQIGQGRREDACRAATTGLVLNLAVALTFSLVGLFASRAIAYSSTKDTEIAEMCRQYMQICVVFCPGIFLEKQGQRMLQAVGNTTLSMVCQICGAVTNLILDPIMIFGLFGFPALGIRGAAIATVAGQWVGGLLSLVLNRIYNPSIHIRLRGHRFLKEDVRMIYRVGAPSMIMQASSSLMFSVVNGILIGISPTAVAFFGVYYKLQSFLMMPVGGLGQSAIPIAGYNLGAREGGRIQATWRVILRSAVGISLVGTAVFLAFPRVLLGFFSAQCGDAGHGRARSADHLAELRLRRGDPGLRLFRLRPWQRADRHDGRFPAAGGAAGPLHLDPEPAAWAGGRLVCLLDCGERRLCLYLLCLKAAAQAQTGFPGKLNKRTGPGLAV